MTPPDEAFVPGPDTSDEARAVASRDFGGLSQGRTREVLKPGTVEELARVVRAAAGDGKKLTPRGRGLSQSGQSIPRDGSSLDLGDLTELGTVNTTHRRVWVGPGVTFRGLLAHVSAHGLRPPVMPLNLDLSVGGVLSAGGFGSTSFSQGVVASHVAALDVVTGTGDLVRTSRTERREVFDAVLGGLGRSGVMARAELELVPAPGRTRMYYLFYQELPVLLRDMAVLALRPGVDHLEGFCSASIQGLALGPSGRREPLVHWVYGLHVGSEFEPRADPPAASRLLEGLSSPRLLKADDDDTRAFAARYDLRFEMMRQSGAWGQAHPWLECLLPFEGAADVIAQALALLPPFLGDGHRLFLVAADERPYAVAFPNAEKVLGFAVLPAGVPEPLLPAALAALRRVEDLLLRAGGKRYLSGYLGEMTEDRWRAHYGKRYDELVRRQSALDPAGVFESCLGALGTPPASAARALPDAVAKAR